MRIDGNCGEPLPEPFQILKGVAEFGGTCTACHGGAQDEIGSDEVGAEEGT